MQPLHLAFVFGSSRSWYIFRLFQYLPRALNSNVSRPDIPYTRLVIIWGTLAGVTTRHMHYTSLCLSQSQIFRTMVCLSQFLSRFGITLTILQCHSPPVNHWTANMHTSCFISVFQCNLSAISESLIPHPQLGGRHTLTVQQKWMKRIQTLIRIHETFFSWHFALR